MIWGTNLSLSKLHNGLSNPYPQYKNMFLLAKNDTI